MKPFWVMARIAPRLSDLLGVSTLFAFIAVFLIGWQSFQSPGTEAAIAGLACAVVILGGFWGRSGRPLFDNLVRLPGFALWLYVYHRQAGVVIDELGFRTWESELRALDQLVFGGDLSVIVQSLYSPGLTEVVQIAYSLFYVVLVGLPLVLTLQGRHREMAEVLGTITIAHTLLVCGNLLFPARWPVLFHQVEHLAGLMEYPCEMEGLWATAWIRDQVANGTRMLWDSMPSGHTCITLLMVFASYRAAPKLFWLMVPLAFGIIFGTVYLRYHYGVDLLGGLVLASLVHGASPRLQALWLRAAEGSIDEGEALQ